MFAPQSPESSTLPYATLRAAHAAGVWMHSLCAVVGLLALLPPCNPSGAALLAGLAVELHEGLCVEGRWGAGNQC
jgi:hypothetical protein